MGNVFTLGIPALSLCTLLCVLWLSKFRAHVIARSGQFFPLRNRISTFLYIYGRKLIYAAALAWALCIFGFVSYTVPTVTYSLALLMRCYALTALFLLYAVLAPGIIMTFFPRFSANMLLIRFRRAAGVSVFFFAFLHATIAFFVNLSGKVSSVLFLSQRNQTALLFSASAFCIFSLLAITSFDGMEKTLGKRWKQLHRFIYVASLFVVFHAFLIGSHFTDPTGLIPLLTNYLSLSYILLEVAATVRRRIMHVSPWNSVKNIPLWIALGSLVLGGFIASITAIRSKYDPHAAHRKGYSKNYSLSIVTDPKNITAGTPVTLAFRVTDKRSGATVKRFQTVMEKLMHVVVLRKDLLVYDHIHPDYDANGNFSISHIFPTDGTYNLYVEYSPPDFYENVSIATVHVGVTAAEKTAHLSDLETKKIFNNTAITLSYSRPIRINDTVDFTFTLADSTTGQPVVDVEPYLSAFGHMSAVSEDLITYAHVHPIQVPLSLQDRGGPRVQFSTFFPKPGPYKLFTQFKRNGEVFVTDFVVEVQ